MVLPFLRDRAQSGLIVQDADSLMVGFGSSAYEVGLGQVRDANRPSGHWDKVRWEIARRTDRTVGVDTSTRYLYD
jgi:hypothetical protein